MGGTDDESNLTPPISVAEHAEEHRKLYEKYGKQEDYLAWKGLAGIIGKEEIVRRAMGLKSRENIKKARAVVGRKYHPEVNLARSRTLSGVKKTEEHRMNISKGSIGKVFSEEHKKNLSEKKKGNKNRAKPITLNGVQYESTAAAARELGCSPTKIKSMIKKGNNDVITR